MTMKLNWKFLFVPALAILAIGCAGEGSSETAISSRPAAERDSRELPVNTSPGADGNYDPARAGATSPTGPTTTIAFNEYEFDFGTLTQGDAVTHLFVFTN